MVTGVGGVGVLYVLSVSCQLFTWKAFRQLSMSDGGQGHFSDKHDWEIINLMMKSMLKQGKKLSLNRCWQHFVVTLRRKLIFWVVGHDVLGFFDV